jgi:hypothetical protein
MAYDKNNAGALFKNVRKTDEKHADCQGSALST